MPLFAAGAAQSADKSGEGRGINFPGDYHRDYGPDPVAWIRREQTGEFAHA
jgi:hypothetical protein